MRKCIPNNECQNKTEERCNKCRTWHGKYGMKEPRRKCPRCGAKLVHLHEPFKTQVINAAIEHKHSVKLPLLCCPECKWEWHYGILTPITLASFNNMIARLQGEYWS
jgi:hypothetical protein